MWARWGCCWRLHTSCSPRCSRASWTSSARVCCSPPVRSATRRWPSRSGSPAGAHTRSFSGPRWRTSCRSRCTCCSSASGGRPTDGSAGRIGAAIAHRSAGARSRSAPLRWCKRVGLPKRRCCPAQSALCRSVCWGGRSHYTRRPQVAWPASCRTRSTRCCHGRPAIRKFLVVRPRCTFAPRCLYSCRPRRTWAWRAGWRRACCTGKSGSAPIRSFGRR